MRTLNQIVLTALPPEYPLESVAKDDVAATLGVVDGDQLTSRHVAEIRRAIDKLDPSFEDTYSDDPVLFPWVWSAQALLNSLGQLRLQSAETVLVVHLEPVDFPADIALFLQDEVRRLVTNLLASKENPLGHAVLQAYRRWLRLLPKGCANLRMMLASNAPLSPGLAESLSTDLTRSFEAGTDSWFGTAAVLVPESPSELDACAALLEDCRSISWREPADADLARLAYMFDPMEANTAFRLPISPSGGLAGLATQRVSSISRGRAVGLETQQTSIGLGTTSAGERLRLTTADLNRHTLVAGLPGFGKSSTVQLLLTRALEELDVPFLVLDPSKSDYRSLFANLAAEGRDVAVIRLTPHSPAFNPLSIPDGVDRFAHAGRVIAAFDSAFDLSEQWPLAHLELVRVVHRLYETSQQQPTLRDLYRELGATIRNSRFSGDVRSNLEGSLLGRIEYLAAGPMGRALLGGPRATIDWASIMGRPTLIELGAFTGSSERSLMFGLLIAGLVSHVEAHPSHGVLRHLTVLEEAHRVLRAGSGRDSGVEVFVDAIAELRSAGEGFIVVDQAPSSLHPGVSKLTGTKIIHRVVEEAERKSLGAAMVLDDAQVDDVARLATRRAIVYTSTATEAALIDVDELHTTSSPPQVVASGSMTLDPVPQSVFCVGCPHMCEGSGGLRRLETLVADQALDWSDHKALLRRSFALLPRTKSADRRRKQAYCLSAAGLADRADQANPPQSVSSQLEILRRSYRQLLLQEERKVSPHD
ncbi:ATP-binding protein [Nocardioides plantarum]|uniref:ATP-binding protein n=1 Tax=Nocardioides plantarum TaxID=29299 RepID=A0ABV5KHL0_9ACTN|nr:DUF87 domain-containing protein [Nocardioides plantarum]